MHQNQLFQDGSKFKIIRNDNDMNLPQKPKILKQKSFKNILLKSLSSKKSLNKTLKRVETEKSEIEKLKQFLEPGKNSTKNLHMNNRDLIFLNESGPAKIQKLHNRMSKRSSQQIKKNQTEIYDDSDSIQQSQRKKDSNKVYKSQARESADIQRTSKASSTSQFRRKLGCIRGLNSNPSQQYESMSYRPIYGSKLIKRQKTRSVSLNRQSDLNMVNSTDPYFMAQNRFYHYCARQIVKLTRHNKQLLVSIKQYEKQGKILAQKGQQLEVKINRKKQQIQNFRQQKLRLEQKRETLNQQLTQYQRKVESQLPQSYKETYKSLYVQNKQDLENKLNQIKRQQVCIKQLRQSIAAYKSQIEEQRLLQQDNTRIRQQIEQLRTERIICDSKLLKKNHIVKHLNEIKAIQFENLLAILKQSHSKNK